MLFIVKSMVANRVTVYYDIVKLIIKLKNIFKRLIYFIYTFVQILFR